MSSSPAVFEHESQRVSLCDMLDRILNKGVVLTGEVVISVADVELVYVGLQTVIASVETIRAAREPSN